MKKNLLFFILPLLSFITAQTQTWSKFTDSTVTYSSPRAADLNGDGVKDIVIGAGKEGLQTNFGVLAFDGVSGNNLWTRPAKNEVFTSAQFQDITNDGVPDVFIGGRSAQFYAINGANGNLIWQFFPYSNLNPADSGWYNFYSAQIIPDMNNDGVPDLLVANGGDHSAPVWQTNRPPGFLMVLNAVNGNILAKAVMPDSAETYCSPVVADVKGNGTLYIIFGTGGETLGGSMYIAELVNGLMNNNLSQAIPLATHPTKGFIAPASVGKYSNDGSRDIIVQGYDGTIYRFNGNTFGLKWSKNFPGTESSAAPVLGNFTGNLRPDVLCVLYKGVAPSYTDFYQVMLDGSNGNLVFKDSIGSMHFVSGNAVDLNGDGRDEALISINNNQGSFKHQIKSIDFQSNTVTNLTGNEAGCNIGSTPLITDLDNDQQLDIVYAYRADSLNPMGNKGMFVKRINTGSIYPAHQIAWGSYMGTQNNGEYTTNLVDCGPGSIISAITPVNPTCNGLTNGAVIPNTSNGTPPFNFYWSTGSADSVLLNVGAGTYSLNIVDANGCFESASTNLVDPYTISFGGLISPTCPGSTNGQITVSSSGCYCMFSGCTFVWNNGTTGYTAGGLSAGNYTVTVTHANGCVVTPTVSIADGLPVIADALINNVSCNGLGNGNIKLTATDPNSAMYHWNTGDSTFLINNLSPGNYSVAVSDARPCIDTLNFTITEPTALSLSVSSTPQSTGAFSDGTATAYISGGTPPYSYLWNDSQSQTTPTASGLVFGYYSVLVTDSNGCIIIDSALVDISLFISKNDSPEEIMVYPNPAEQNSVIVFSGISDDILMTITDMNGRLVYEINKPETKSVIVKSQSFSKGVYNCRIINEKQVKNIKLVIN
ncbi:MAG: T9SS type A sorting domain-containing protein [Bacteroidota bacterium]